MQVDVLGPVRVRADDRSIDLGGPRNRALVARLALGGGRPVSAATLIDDLWGPDVPDDPKGALQSVVSRTRRRLPSDVLDSTPAGYVLRGTTVDADEFERLVAAGRAEEALALWRGEPLADLTDLPFAAAAAPRLQELRLTAIETSLESRVRIDPTVVAELAELTADHPYRDGFWRLHLTALACHGRANEALAAYERLRASLADDLGTDPSAELQELHLSILRGEQEPRRSHPSLPAGLTSFVGRETAIADLRSALEDHRLVTILGPGGAGKTRLAIETARSALDRFDDVWLAELAPVTGEDGIVRAILAAMGQLEVVVRDRTQIAHRLDERARLIEAVRDVRGLLLIDNCEHLVDGVARVTEDLLEHAPRLRVIATSREPLRIIGEYAYQLRPLTSPGDDATPEEALQHSAVALFVLRARAVDQAFVLDAETLPAVREICRRLDGQPLAIELAAARLRTLTVAQVAARLGDRFRLLTGGSRTALPRHRTLRAVVEWSWDLLEDAERDLVERLAVFPGGVTVESAAAVAAPGADVEALLDSLADKSLLVPVRGEHTRFRMLETLREYGVERLLDHGLAESVRDLHLTYFGDLVTTQSVLLRGPGQVAALAAIDADHGNVMAALRFAVDRGDRARAGRLVAGLAMYWSIRDQHMESFAWGETVLGLPGTADPASEICMEALALSGLLLTSQFDTSDTAAWREPAGRLLALWDEHQPDDPLVHLVLATMGHLGVTGDRVLPVPEDPWTRAMIDLMRVVMLDNAGRVGETVDVISSTIDAFRELGDQWGLAMALTQQATVQTLDGDVDGALASWAEAVPLLDAMGGTEEWDLSSIRIVELELARMDPSDAEELRPGLDAALERALGSGSPREQAVARTNLAHLEHVLGRESSAAEHLQHVLADMGGRTELGSGQLEAWMRALLAVVLAGSGDLAGADRELLDAASTGRRTRDMPVMAGVAVAAAVVAHHHGQDKRAARVLGATEVIRGRPDRSSRDMRDLSAALATTLGAEVFEALRSEGSAMTQEDAVAFALPGGGAPAGS
ncbi:BTAD domain-containing putative transcriptional regulator [Aeromicrobium chenweiae]|uniref:BTAD domain-containing putative transcriptional regulator n=1 Tax=Aeromicrobium chenweiae TaxID=2079793 RepID=UPI00131EDA23|nr:BTAD domain-containing putative transcriptional regulator [Aeromicrobium chenweiae]